MTGIVPHGTPDYAEIAALGLQPDDLLVFSSNVNPYGPPSAVIEEVRHACTPTIIARYPDRLSLELRATLAEYHNVAPEQIIVGNGTADLMWLLAVVGLTGQRIAIVAPTFGEYQNIASLVDAKTQTVLWPGWQQVDDRYSPGMTTLLDTKVAIERYLPDTIFICNPNNPTGQLLTAQQLEQLHMAAPDALWVIDEAYAEFVPQSWSAAQWATHGQWLVLRSMTKDFALGGLRLGYAVGPAELIDRLQNAQPPWNVNALAQIAGAAAMRELNWRSNTLRELTEQREHLRHALRDAGYRPAESTCNYFLVPVHDAAAVRTQLLAEKIMVRDCTSFGLPDYIRIATQRPDANRRLAASLAQIASTAARNP